MSYTLADIKGDETLVEAMSELYAGDGRTYGDELAAVEDLAGLWTALVDAVYIARRSGDYAAAENIRDAVGRYHVELAEGRTCALYARHIERAVAQATR